MTYQLPTSRWSILLRVPVIGVDNWPPLAGLLHPSVLRKELWQTALAVCTDWGRSVYR